MEPFTPILWLGTFIFLIISCIKDRSKTICALKNALGIAKSMLASILSIIFLITLILTVFPLGRFLTTASIYSLPLATLISVTIGSLIFTPTSFVVPFVNSLFFMPTSIVPIAAFLIALTMVSIITFPLEIKAFGTKFALVRNGLGFIFAILISLVIGVIL